MAGHSRRLLARRRGTAKTTSPACLRGRASGFESSKSTTLAGNELRPRRSPNIPHLINRAVKCMQVGNLSLMRSYELPAQEECGDAEENRNHAGRTSGRNCDYWNADCAVSPGEPAGKRERYTNAIAEQLAADHSGHAWFRDDASGPIASAG